METKGSEIQTMRVKITTMVDADVQRAFRAGESLHGKTAADALDIGMMTVIGGIDPAAVLEIEITRRTHELEEMRKLHAEMRVLDSVQKRMQQFGQDGEKLEASRLALWAREKDRLRKELRRGEAPWARIMWDYQFETRREALAWFRNRIVVEKENAEK